MAAFPLSGTQNLTARYSGDSNYASSTSPAVALSPDFLLTSDISGSGQVAVSPGNSATAAFTITGLDSLNGTVSFNLSGLPKASTGSFAPTSVQITPTTVSGLAVLTIQTTAARTTSVMFPFSSQFASWLGFEGLPIIGLFISSRQKNRCSLKMFFGIVLVALLFSLGGCGGGGGGSNSGYDPGTPVGTYTVTVTATSGSLSHTMTFKLVVD